MPDGICQRNPVFEQRGGAMSLRINDIAPDFTADTTEGPISFHEWIGDGYAVLFSHPKDFTPVCTTELGTMAGLKAEFDKRNAKIIGISVDPVESHEKWKGDIQKATGHAVNYPMIGDKDLKVAKLYDMLPASAGDSSEGRTPVDNQTVRSVFVIGPDKRIKLILTYPMSTGRNFQEILRAIDSIQLTAKHSVSTPADWKQGDDVVIGGAISDEEAIKRFGAFDAVLPYLRKTKQPTA
jgi:alkyl hydroperoxide reductase subunit AhpC